MNNGELVRIEEKNQNHANGYATWGIKCSEEFLERLKKLEELCKKKQSGLDE